jgi:PAS domain S-box-containing protein
MDSDRRPLAFYAYLVALTGTVVVILAAAIVRGEGFDSNRWQWLVFVALLGITESLSMFFHQRTARYSLSAAEAVLLPMIVVLTLPQVVLGAVIANSFGRLPRWRVAPLKEIFNLAQYGTATAAAAWLYGSLHDGTTTLTLADAGVAVLAVLFFGLLSHIFVAGAIALSGEGRFREMSLAIAPAFMLNLVGDVIMGLLFTASYLHASWTLFLFGFSLVAMFLGYRAVMRQSQGRERVEYLHQATRALSSSPDFAVGLTGFLQAVAEMMSASEVRVLVEVQGNRVWSSLRDGQLEASLRPDPNLGLERLLDRFSHSSRGLLVREDQGGSDRELASDLAVRSFIGVPIGEDPAQGCLMVAGRVGAGEFEEGDARLLEALAGELLVRLEAHRLFAQVAEERERFGRIFNGSQEGICLLDAGGVVRAWNPALESITGHPAIDLMGRMWSDIVVIRDREENRVVGQELVATPPDEELELVTRHGPSRWISVASGPVGEAEGGGWVVLMRDVTGEHELETAKSDFLSTISHELRTPLTTIKGALQVLGRGRDNLPGDLADQMVGVTTRGAERLERLVMNLLAVSQIESNSMNIFPDELRMEAVAQDRFESMLAQHARKKIVLPDDTLVIRGDRERTTHVIEHLLDNAMKFGGADGEITLEVVRENGYAHLIVTDEGPGIAKADQDRIFERFVRLGDVLTRTTQGAGVGLFIARRLVEAMGGEIWVESALGEGATFHATFPLAFPAAVPDHATGA